MGRGVPAPTEGRTRPGEEEWRHPMGEPRREMSRGRRARRAMAKGAAPSREERSRAHWPELGSMGTRLPWGKREAPSRGRARGGMGWGRKSRGRECCFKGSARCSHWWHGRWPAEHQFPERQRNKHALDGYFCHFLVWMNAIF
jgi:hypothetical protein